MQEAPQSTFGTRPERTLRDWLRIAFYSGSRYRCPFCGYRARRWTPIGFDLPILHELKVAGAGRREAGCFRCGSNDRERLIHAFLQRSGILDRIGTMRVLHVAPEIILREFFQRRAKPRSYVIGDKTMPGYQYPPEVVDLDVQHLSFPDNSFDLILCNHVLEHVPDDHAAMRELYRVLAPGGVAVLQVPYAWRLAETDEDPSVTDPKAREARFGQFDHVRMYGADYATRLAHAGFAVETLMLGQEDSLKRCGLATEEPLFIGRKP